MRVTGTLTKQVEIDITAEEAVKALARHFNVYIDLFPTSSAYSKVEVNKDTGEKNLVRYEDCSYHGSPYYKEFGRIDDQNKIAAYEHLRELLELVKD